MSKKPGTLNKKKSPAILVGNPAPGIFDEKETSKKTVAGFISKVTAKLNKSEAEKEQEKIVAFQRRTIIMCNTQIGLINNREIPTLETEITELAYKLEVAETALEDAKYTIANTPEEYVRTYNRCEEAVEQLEDQIRDKSTQVITAQAKAEKFQQMLEWLS